MCRILPTGPEHLGWEESRLIVRFWIAALVFALFALTTLTRSREFPALRF
jgi:UDP-N-acetylmuramyl pentapeptide phosphotransferase/UDP-N-acetylglucosamine-1-phosphate transferase